jgi:class 3 adenylate cyclase
MEPQVQYTTTPDGASIAFYEMGEGPPLVIVSSVLWSHLRLTFIPEYHRSGAGIGRGRRVIRYDSRGTGLSSRDTLDFSLKARVTDLECVIDHLGIHRFALFAGAHAGPAAIAYTASHPERVTHLILWHPYARGKDANRRFDSFESLRSAGDWMLYTTTIANVNMGFKDSALAERMARRMRESMTFESVQALIEHAKAIDVFDLLPQVQVPTLVVWTEGIGEEATILSLESAKATAARIPGARLFTYRAAGFTRWSDKATQAAEEFLGDAKPEATPSGSEASAFRSVLFTDLVGHTEMMQRLGDEKGREVLREHERITREVLKAHGGTEVKTMGDGFMASFGSVTKAVECAVALQRKFEERMVNGEGERLAVRCGLNAGEPIEEDGDLFGSTVILASRIAAAAQGGEVLASMAVRELCAGKGFAFADRGEQAMRGFEDPVRVFEVNWREQ